MKDKFLSEFRVTIGACWVVEYFYDDDDRHAMDYFYDQYAADISFEYMLFKKVYMHTPERVFPLWCFIAQFEKHC